jgi:hypothetical protein
MTRDERRIIEFLFNSNVTELADLPDWLLALVEGDNAETFTHELTTAASFLYARRLRPGIGFADARTLLAEYTTDPDKLEELAQRINAFRLSCCFERLRRAGRYEAIAIDDPFEPDGKVSVTLTEADWLFLNSHPTENELRLYRQSRWSMN